MNQGDGAIKTSIVPLLEIKNIVNTKILAGIVFFFMIAGFVGNISPLYVFAQVDNQTSTNTEPSIPANATNSENETAVSEKITDFVHNAMLLFKEQRDETIQTIKDCHANLANSTGTQREQIMKTCKTNLQSIHDKYLDVKSKYRDLFMQYKEHMHVFVKEAKGKHVSASEKKYALGNIMKIRHYNQGTKDVLHGMGNIIRGHKMIGSGHPFMGQRAIEKGKLQIMEGTHEIKKT